MDKTEAHFSVENVILLEWFSGLAKELLSKEGNRQKVRHTVRES